VIEESVMMLRGDQDASVSPWRSCGVNNAFETSPLAVIIIYQTHVRAMKKKLRQRKLVSEDRANISKV
jgi:hypothetical protein